MSERTNVVHQFGYGDQAVWVLPAGGGSTMAPVTVLGRVALLPDEYVGVRYGNQYFIAQRSELRPWEPEPSRRL